MNNDLLKQEALDLLKSLIAIPSFSKEEEQTATRIEYYLQQKGIKNYRTGNNVYAVAGDIDLAKPTLLLNSHHDTVKPNPQYTKDPFTPIIENEKLYGLGANDAGGPLVALMAAFLHYHSNGIPGWNLVLAATAEEEISGSGGVEALLKDPLFIQQTKGCFTKEFLHPHTCAIVGEPTLLSMAVAERGLLVLDAIATGKAGHAAREEGDNALYHALNAIKWFQSYEFENRSVLLGPVKMSVTVIETENKAHNVVPATCRFVVDVRVNERYTFEEIITTIKSELSSSITIQPRSTRLRSSMIDLEHPLVKAGLKNNLNYYGSPTTSDKALIPFPALKLGPGNSARSHSADEWIGVDEIKNGIDCYCKLIDQLASK
jgi:acetylornithine deacetylase